MRVEWCVAACLAATLVGGPAQAQGRPPNYGGGFIEFLMTGTGEPGRPVAARCADLIAAP